MNVFKLIGTTKSRIETTVQLSDIRGQGVSIVTRLKLPQATDSAFSQTLAPSLRLNIITVPTKNLVIIRHSHQPPNQSPAVIPTGHEPCQSPSKTPMLIICNKLFYTTRIINIEVPTAPSVLCDIIRSTPRHQMRIHINIELRQQNRILFSIPQTLQYGNTRIIALIVQTHDAASPSTLALFKQLVTIQLPKLIVLDKFPYATRTINIRIRTSSKISFHNTLRSHAAADHVPRRIEIIELSC